MTLVGELSLWAALFLSLWAVVAPVAGARLDRPEIVASGRRAIPASAVMATTACVGILAALLGHDFALEYVAAHTTLNTPTFYRLTAIWAGPAGRLLFLGAAVAVCAAVAVRGVVGDAYGRALAVSLSVAVALVLVVSCFVTYPYDRIEWVPAEGRGLAPRLQTPLAAAHFATTYVGYAAAVVVLAHFASAATSARTGMQRSARAYRWSALCWSMLTIAIALHMRWAYLDPSTTGLARSVTSELTTVGAWLASFGLLWLIARHTRVAVVSRRRGVVQRIGAAVAVFGLALVVAGVIAGRSWSDRSIELDPGASAELVDASGNDWRFVSQGVSRDEQINFLSTSAAVEVWRDATRLGIISAERRQYLDSMQRPVSEVAVTPGIRSSLRRDVYVVLTGLRDDAAQLRIAFRPLVALVWIGWPLLLIGGLAFAASLALPRRAAVGSADSST